jgi:iron complex transport system permease protein
MRYFMKNNFFMMIILLIVVLFLAMALSFFTGSVPLSPFKLFAPELKGILVLRISRIALGLTAGAALAVVGCILQGLLKNPLADPYVLGISSGAGLGAVVAIISGAAVSLPGGLAVPVFAFLFGLLAIFFVYFLSKKAGRVGTEDLLLSGVIITSMLSGIIMFIVSATEREGLHSALWWLLGNTQVYNLRLLFIICAVSIAGIISSVIFSRNLNIMSLGEEQAIAMGMDTERIKLVFFIISSVMTAVIVSACGMIGFVGLIIPHCARRMTGSDHRRLIPISALLGAIYLVLCDIIARKLTQPIELPIGVITAMVGAPFFIFLLKRSKVPK